MRLLERLEAELDEQRLQELDGGQLRLADVRETMSGRQLGQETLDQRGLTGADVAGDHDEAVGEPDGGLHVRLGARVLFAGRYRNCGSGREPERRFLEFEKVAIHREADLTVIQARGA